MPVVAAGLSAAGSIVGGLSAKAQADASAEQQRLQAKRVQEMGAITEEAFKKQASAALASSIAASGVSGIMQSDFDDTRANFARDARLQALRIQNNTLGQVISLNTSADNAKKAGNIALFSSVLSAGSSILGASGGGGRTAPPTTGNTLPTFAPSGGVGGASAGGLNALSLPRRR